jgi:hypothetical protein
VARLTNASSKKIDNHDHAIALHYVNYNSCRVNPTLPAVPAMGAGITDHLWSIEETVDLLDRSANIAAYIANARFVVGRRGHLPLL